MSVHPTDSTPIGTGGRPFQLLGPLDCGHAEAQVDAPVLRRVPVAVRRAAFLASLFQPPPRITRYEALVVHRNDRSTRSRQRQLAVRPARVKATRAVALLKSQWAKFAVKVCTVPASVSMELRHDRANSSPARRAPRHSAAPLRLGQVSAPPRHPSRLRSAAPFPAHPGLRPGGSPVAAPDHQHVPAAERRAAVAGDRSPSYRRGAPGARPRARPADHGRRRGVVFLVIPIAHHSQTLPSISYRPQALG